jgi:hypothetical protein
MLVQVMATGTVLATATETALATAQRQPTQETLGATARHRTTAQPGATWRPAPTRLVTTKRPTGLAQAGARRSEELHEPCSDRRRYVHQQKQEQGCVDCPAAQDEHLFQYLHHD